MKLTERLKLEHQIFRQLLERMEEALSKTADGRARALRAALRILLPALETHERIEETVLFSALKGKNGAVPAFIGEYRRGHKDIQETLAFLREVLQGEVPLESTAESVTRLLFLLREHMLEEERVLFPAIDEILGERVLTDLNASAHAKAARLPRSLEAR